MKNYHYISGLPRSGSTLLCTILNQNPVFHADISSPLARFVRSIVVESFASPGYKLQCDELKRYELIRSLVSTYYYDKPEKEVYFNTNRGWTALLGILDKTHPTSKIICCVRDINWILDSFELLFRKNPFTVSSMYSPEEAETVYSRCNALMSPGHTLRFAYDCLKEAITGPQKHNLLIVEYDQLANNTEQVMKALYNFIDQPYFKHNFSTVEGEYPAFDQEANIPDLHKIRKGVSFMERKTIIPPDIWNKYCNLEVWRG